ncbi:uncharacterized protein si:cabz01074946.1 isoform X1 [Lates calcarifer]|uniref:Uncharacterized protein si:cabz01074946.1 isoform X1 n=1 Tax=Lates calcarifer TaxID=8187 RepID=A0A4W6EFL2_LATCA|nr:uncharacterized protein si:cabz01074946.1 isoform X1 [Lates calcarifer]XP_018543390.1 uncharacterized protein si:cabz01074946.1 isoform X1 [Lates calcarifer]
MSRLLVLISCFQVVLAEPYAVISGYLGDNVTLPSRADRSWHLSKIEWSVFTNNTWIATYRNGKTNIERISQFKGRLSLNITSGDLMIHGLTKEDCMEYTVDLINTEKTSTVNKLRLQVKEHLQKPTITTLFSTPEKGGCWMGLHCSSPDRGVNFSWQVIPDTRAAFSMWDPSGNHGVFLAFLNTTSKLNFTCTSSRTMESTSSTVTPQCNAGDKPEPQLDCRDRCGLCFLLGGVIMGTCIIIVYIFREEIKAAWKYLSDKFCPSTIPS